MSIEDCGLTHTAEAAEVLSGAPRVTYVVARLGLLTRADPASNLAFVRTLLLARTEDAMTATTSSNAEPLKLYWQPGCTACLRMKEFFNRHGVEYVSINVLADPQGLDELVKLAGRHIPIARRGNEWADGQVLADLARIGGIELGDQKVLSPPELAARAENLLVTVERLATQIPESKMRTLLPDRPRTYEELVSHIVQIIEAFVDVVEGVKPLTFESYHQAVPANVQARADLVAFSASVRERFAAWWRAHGNSFDFRLKADVYYGDVDLHEYFERSVWHGSQHARQLALVVEKLGIVPDRPLSSEDLAGLPLPENIWDDKMEFRALG